MSFKRNDIVSKQRLRDALEEETAMGFSHNDIVTTYAMDKAIAEGGGGGGGDFSTCTVTVSCTYEGVGQASVGSFFYVDNDINLISYTDTHFYDDDEEKDPITLTNVILYQGYTEVELRDGSYVSSTGAVNYDSESHLFTITGDCTITVALAN